MKSYILFVTLLALSTAVSGCVERYDAPPETSIVLPDGGSFVAGEVVLFEFSEPINPETFAVSVWPDDRTIENEFSEDAEPFVERCSGDCSDVIVSIDEDRRLATLEFNGESLGKAGVPLIVEIHSGLEDDEGNDTGASKLFAVKFRPPDDRFNEEPVEFQDGVYILVAQVTDPLPATLTLVSDLQVTEAGEMRLAGAEGDEIQGAAKNTRDPDEIVVDTTDQGWTAYTSGFVKLEDGKRFLRSDSFDVELPVVGLVVKLFGVRLDAEVTEPDETGNDRIEGTLSFESLELWRNGELFDAYEGGNTALIADWVPPEAAPSGYPLVCGDLCGDVSGLCSPPPQFPGDEFCQAP